MNQRAMDEMRRRTGIDGWRWYLWAIPYTAGFAFMTWFTFRNGIWAIVLEPRDFYLWCLCLIALVSLWRARPQKKKQDAGIRLNLN
jgi:hypothetical protein